MRLFPGCNLKSNKRLGVGDSGCVGSYVVLDRLSYKANLVKGMQADSELC